MRESILERDFDTFAYETLGFHIAGERNTTKKVEIPKSLLSEKEQKERKKKNKQQKNSRKKNRSKK